MIATVPTEAVPLKKVTDPVNPLTAELTWAVKVTVGGVAVRFGVTVSVVAVAAGVIVKLSEPVLVAYCESEL